MPMFSLFEDLSRVATLRAMVASSDWMVAHYPNSLYHKIFAEISRLLLKTFVPNIPKIFCSSMVRVTRVRSWELLLSSARTK